MRNGTWEKERGSTTSAHGQPSAVPRDAARRGSRGISAGNRAPCAASGPGALPPQPRGRSLQDLDRPRRDARVERGTGEPSGGAPRRAVGGRDLGPHERGHEADDVTGPPDAGSRRMDDTGRPRAELDVVPIGRRSVGRCVRCRREPGDAPARRTARAGGGRRGLVACANTGALPGRCRSRTRRGGRRRGRHDALVAPSARRAGLGAPRARSRGRCRNRRRRPHDRREPVSRVGAPGRPDDLAPRGVTGGHDLGARRGCRPHRSADPCRHARGDRHRRRRRVDQRGRGCRPGGKPPITNAWTDPGITAASPADDLRARQDPRDCRRLPGHDPTATTPCRTARGGGRPGAQNRGGSGAPRPGRHRRGARRRRPEAQPLTGRRAGRAHEPRGPSARTSPRGLPNKGIARQLGISPKIVGNHIEHVYNKLAVSSRAGAAMHATKLGFVDSTSREV